MKNIEIFCSIEIQMPLYSRIRKKKQLLVQKSSKFIYPKIQNCQIRFICTNLHFEKGLFSVCYWFDESFFVSETSEKIRKSTFQCTIFKFRFFYLFKYIPDVKWYFYTIFFFPQVFLHCVVKFHKSKVHP